MQDYDDLLKRARYIQHKVSHLALNLAIMSGKPNQKRIQRIVDALFELAKMPLEKE